MGQINQRSSLIEYIVFFFILLFAIGVIYDSLSGSKPDPLSDAIDRRVSLVGVIDIPTHKSRGEQFVLHTSEYGVLVSTATPIDVRYGDEVVVMGILSRPSNFVTDQGSEFNYVSYLYKDDVLYRVDLARVVVRAHDKGNWLIAKLIPLKQGIIAQYQRVLSLADASLLAGINLGEKGGVSNEFRNELITTGTIHIIALSGYNVTIVATFLRQVLVALPHMSLRFANACGAIGIVLFVLLTGAQSSAVRAGVMALIALYAESSGKRYNAFRALICAGFIMVLWNPKYLVYDVSFQLSFLATFGIIFVTPLLLRAFVRIPEKVLFVFPLRELMAATLGAQIGTLPFILYKTGNLSLIALPANIVVLPAISFTMATGAIAGLLGGVSLGIAYPFVLITHGLLWYIQTAIHLFARVPYAALVFHNVPLWLCCIAYVIIGVWIWDAWRTQEDLARFKK